MQPAPRALALPTLAAALVLAGCVDGPRDLAPSTTQAPALGPSHVLADALEPDGLEAPLFRLIGAVAKGGPAYGAGEPSIWAHLDGTTYLAFPGCDQGPYLVSAPGVPACNHGLVYRSEDGGATWTRLNREEDGRLAPPGKEGGPNANGDAEVTVDAAGTVYTSNLGAGGIQVWRSDDRGDSWTYLGNVTRPHHWADRQWMAAAAPGHVIATWMGGALASEDNKTYEDVRRAVAVTTTRDGGNAWTAVQYLGENIGWIGPVHFDPDGERAYVPFTQVKEARHPVNVFGMGLGGNADYQLLVGRTLDGGATWDVVDTGVVVTTSATGMHWSGVLMAPTLDVTGDGTVIAAWSEEVLDPTGKTSLGAALRYVASTDAGETWTAPATVSERASAIMPWVTGGAGDRFALTWFASDVPLDTDYAGRWDVVAAVVDGAASGSPAIARSVIDEDVHLGGLCAKGGGCFTSGSDRALLDFFESDLLPDGRLIVTYPADPPQGGKHIEIRIAVQDGGTPLALPPLSK